MSAQNNRYHYTTVLEAIEQLRQKGYTVDFNLQENCIACDESTFEHDEFDVVEVYRYEGESNPSDEATVYGIESTSGLKGILVTGHSNELDGRSQAILRKLQY